MRNVFLPKTTVTRFCSKSCDSRNGKLRARKAKIALMDQVIKRVLEKSEEKVLSIEFLNVKNVAKLLLNL
jgi:hypothetical protein